MKKRDKTVDCSCREDCENDCRCFCHTPIIIRNFFWKYINPKIRTMGIKTNEPKIPKLTSKYNEISWSK